MRTTIKPATIKTATDTIALVVDRPAAPYLIKAYRGRKVVAYAIQDAYGWAIVARRQGERNVATIDRFTPLYPAEPSADIRDAAIRGLARIAATWRGHE
jgi:hypothetical protein